MPSKLDVFRRTRAAYGLLLIVGMLAPAVAAAQSSFLGPTSHSIYVRSNVGGIYDYELDLQSDEPLIYTTGVVLGLNGGSFDVTGATGGGSLPYAFIEGESFAGGPFNALGLARARVEYDIGVSVSAPYLGPLNGVSIPVIISGFNYVRINPVRQFGAGAFAEAAVWVDGPGVSFQEFAAVQTSVFGPAQADAQGWTRLLNLTSGVAYHVELYTSGNGAGWHFYALADPVFEIDPDATFEWQGQTVSFSDAATLVYSEGIEAPEPGFGIALTSGMLLLSGASSRRARQGSRAEPRADLG